MDDTQFLAGFPVMPIDKTKLASNAYVLACIAQGIVYGMGDKESEKTLGAFPPDYTAIDCSGFMRAFVAYLTGKTDVMPDGSWNEKDWLAKEGYKVSEFESCGLVDNVVRICVFEESGKTGHIWMVFGGKTFESHGSAGPSNRDWNNPTLMGISGNTTVFAVA